MSNVANHRHICWFQERNGQSKMFKLEFTHRSKVIAQCVLLCNYRASWDRDELRCQLFSDNMGALLAFCHAKPCMQQPMLAFLFTCTFMHLADCCIQSDLQCNQAIHFFCQYVCSLGIEPTTFCAANAMLYHWPTGRQYTLLKVFTNININ